VINFVLFLSSLCRRKDGAKRCRVYSVAAHRPAVVAVIIAHIDIGTLGMEGAFEAMATGEVDLNWANEHHDLWLERQLGEERLAARSGQSSAVPVE
jgi:cytochrome b subunit of formate dehydrogenase